MAFRTQFRWRHGLPATAGLVAGAVLFPMPAAFAEAPEHTSKKPIYEDPLLEKKSRTRAEVAPTLPSDATTPSLSTASPSPSPPLLPTPTDRLASEIRRARLFLHAHAAVAEDKFNSLMTSFFDLETSFTSTIAGLAPPKESGERLMPGVIYVLVAAMGGSIVSRNRNILLRATVPLAVGVGASWLVLPITTRNVGDLVWTFEQKSPFISSNHLRIRDAVNETWRIAREAGQTALQAVDETVQSSRDNIQDWVKKGK